VVVTTFRILLEFVEAPLDPTDLLAVLLLLEVDPLLELVVAPVAVELDGAAGLAVVPALLAVVPAMLAAPPVVPDPLVVEPVPEALLDEGELAVVVVPLGPLVVVEPVPVAAGPPVPVAPGPATPVPVAPGPATPVPVAPGPATPVPVAPGPATPVPVAGDDVPVDVPVAPAVLVVELGSVVFIY
jgi:hypothetical protein